MITLKTRSVAMRKGEKVEIKGLIKEGLKELSDDRFPQQKNAISIQESMNSARLNSVELNGPNEVRSDSKNCNIIEANT